MTRINAGMPVRWLSNEHLIAEHREIKRIPNAVKNRKVNWNIPIPDKFTLGKGHVRFFYDKIKYLERRYKKIYAECKKRGINVQYYGEAFNLYQPDSFFKEKYGCDCKNDSYELIQKTYKDWTPTQEAFELIKQRIKDNNEKSAAKRNKL
jgi:hypothetical protein